MLPVARKLHLNKRVKNGGKDEVKKPHKEKEHRQEIISVRLLTFTQPGDKYCWIEALRLKLEINVGGHLTCEKAALEVSEV